MRSAILCACVLSFFAAFVAAGQAKHDYLTTDEANQVRDDAGPE